MCASEQLTLRHHLSVCACVQPGGSFPLQQAAAAAAADRRGRSVSALPASVAGSGSRSRRGNVGVDGAFVWCFVGNCC